MFVEEIAKEVLSHHDKVGGGGGLGCNTKHKRNTQPNTNTEEEVISYIPTTYMSIVPHHTILNVTYLSYSVFEKK